MTSIKPPATSVPAPTDLAGDASAARSERADQASFQGAVRDAQAGQGAAGVTAATGVASADPIAALSQQIRAGTLSVDQAIDRLVERATEGGMAKHLGTRERAELTELLRSALASDPTLTALRDDLR